MTKIILSGHFLASPADLAAVREALPGHITASQAEPGCLVFQATEDPETPGQFNLYEEFVDRAAFEQHGQRSQSSPWAKASQNIEKFFDIKEAPSE